MGFQHRDTEQIFSGLEALIRGLGQRRMQTWQMQQQQNGQQLEQRRYDAQQAQQREREAQAERQRNMQIALGLVAPKDRARVAQGFGINLPPGVQPYDPDADKANEDLAGTLERFAPQYSNPVPFIEGAMGARQGHPLPARPPATIGIPGAGVPFAAAPLQAQLPGASGLQNVFDRGGRRLADIADERNQNQALELRRFDEQRAQRLEEERTQRALQVAQLRAQTAAQVAGIRAGTAEDNAYRGAYSTAHVKAQAEYPGAPDQWDQIAARAAAGAVSSFRERAGTGGQPLPDFQGQLPPSLSMQRLGLDRDRFGFERTDKTRRFGLDQGRAVETQRHNQRMEQRPTGAGRGAAVRLSPQTQARLSLLNSRRSGLAADIRAAEANPLFNPKGLDALRGKLAGVDAELEKLAPPVSGGPDQTGALLNDLGLGGSRAPGVVGVQRRGSVSGGFSPGKADMRRRAFAAFAADNNGRSPNAQEQNEISRGVETGSITESDILKSLARRR